MLQVYVPSGPALHRQTWDLRAYVSWDYRYSNNHKLARSEKRNQSLPNENCCSPFIVIENSAWSFLPDDKDASDRTSKKTFGLFSFSHCLRGSDPTQPHAEPHPWNLPKAEERISKTKARLRVPSFTKRLYPKSRKCLTSCPKMKLAQIYHSSLCFRQS